MRLNDNEIASKSHPILLNGIGMAQKSISLMLGAEKKHSTNFSSWRVSDEEKKRLINCHQVSFFAECLVAGCAAEVLHLLVNTPYVT
jgi:hypothetical protein